jgi:SIR2-like domain
VLTLREYCTNYGDAAPEAPDFEKPLPSLLRLILFRSSILFLGCSLAGDRTLGVLKHVASQAPALGHFAIVELPAATADTSKRDKFLSQHGIRPIWYPHGKHESIRTLLDYLVEQKLTPATEQSVLTTDVSIIAECTDVIELIRTEKSVIYECKCSGERRIIKKTDKKICQLARGNPKR